MNKTLSATWTYDWQPAKRIASRRTPLTHAGITSTLLVFTPSMSGVTEAQKEWRILMGSPAPTTTVQDQITKKSTSLVSGSKEKTTIACSRRRITRMSEYIQCSKWHFSNIVNLRDVNAKIDALYEPFVCYRGKISHPYVGQQLWDNPDWNPGATRGPWKGSQGRKSKNFEDAIGNCKSYTPFIWSTNYADVIDGAPVRDYTAACTTSFVQTRNPCGHYSIRR